MATEAEIAWAAGVLEGEGCISWSNSTTVRDGQRLQARVSIAMTDEDVLVRVRDILGCGVVRPNTREGKVYWKPHHKPQWTWEVRARDDVERVLTVLLPWLCARRRERAEEVLAEFVRTQHFRCATCDKNFASSRSDARYCSRSCKTRARSAREGRPPLWRMRTCACCGAEYLGGGQHRVGYCSSRCRYVAKRRRHGLPVPSAEGVI
jgi:hypothetical protein